MGNATFGWFVLCERALFAQDTNNVSMFECLEQVSAAGFPAQIRCLTGVVYFYRDNAHEDFVQRMRLVVEPPGREDVTVAEWNLPFAAGNLRTRSRLVFEDFTFKTHGAYHFRVDVPTTDEEGWTAAARLPLQVVETPEADPGVHTESR